MLLSQSTQVINSFDTILTCTMLIYSADDLVVIYILKRLIGGKESTKDSSEKVR